MNNNSIEINQINNVIDSVEMVNDFQNVVVDAIDPRLASVIRSRNNTNIQKGGLTILSVFQACIMPIFYILGIIVRMFVGIFKELFYLPWRQANRALFWKYLWFCIKCGFYLCIFAVAGPIFIIIGIVMIYKKLLTKMDINASSLVKERLSDATSI
jgi:hypothetical protein